MKKLLIGLSVCLLLLAGCTKPEEKQENPEVKKTPTFDALERVSFETLDEKISNKETMVVYFGWTKQCGDSLNIQANYLEEQLASGKLSNAIYVVDLDEQLPEGLNDKEKRQPMIDAYGVKYSPTIIYYESGINKSYIEWTPATSDPTTAIEKNALDDWFKAIGYLNQ